MRGGPGANFSMRGGKAAIDGGIFRLISSDGSILISDPEGPITDITVAPDTNQDVSFQVGVAVPAGGTFVYTYDVPPTWGRFISTPAFLGVQDPSPAEISIAMGMDLYAVIETVNGFPLRRRVTIFNNSAVPLIVDIAIINFRST